MASRFLIARKMSKVNAFKTPPSSIVPGKKQLSHHSFSIITITGHRQEQSVEAYMTPETKTSSDNIGKINHHSSSAKLSRLESKQVEFLFSLSTSSSVLQLVVDTFTISITVMWLSTDQGQAYGVMLLLHFHRCKVGENAVIKLFLAS